MPAARVVHRRHDGAHLVVRRGAQSAMWEPTVGRKMQTVGNAPSPAMRSIPAIVSEMGSMPAMSSPETAPLGRRAAQYAIASKKSFCPSVLAFPGQIRANHCGSRSSTQNEK